VEAKAVQIDEIPASRIVGCVLAAIALVAGVWYAAFGVSLLVNLPLATHRWIVASGDQDFWLEADRFRLYGAALAVMALGLGLFTIRAAGQTFASRYEPRRHWLLLLGVAILFSLVRGLAEAIAGSFTVWRAGSFAMVCLVYALLWAIDRPPERSSPHRYKAVREV
jgi:hypothetical protein